MCRKAEGLPERTRGFCFGYGCRRVHSNTQAGKYAHKYTDSLTQRQISLKITRRFVPGITYVSLVWTMMYTFEREREKEIKSFGITLGVLIAYASF